jgi:hypothetical protein
MSVSSEREPITGRTKYSLRALAIHRFFLRAALSGVSIFAWVFLFQYFYLTGGDLSRAFAQSAFLYALCSTITCLITPLSARILRGGARRSLLFATLLCASAFVFLGAAFGGFWTSNTALAIAFFAILMGVYRALYWVPYEIEASVQKKPSRSVVSEMVLALAPAIGGIFIAWNSFAAISILYVGALLLFISTVPIFFLRDVHEHFSWGYRQTFHELLAAKHRTIFTHGLLEGVSGAALVFFWPLAIFLITGWSYSVLGIVLTITLLAAICLRTPVRALVRSLGLSDSRVLSATLAVTPWLFRLVIGSPLGVVLVDSYFYTTTPRRFAVDPLAFEQASDGGSLLDEYTAIKEMALSLGRVAVCVLGAGAVLLASVPVAFLIVFVAAAASSVALTLRAR